MPDEASTIGAMFQSPPYNKGQLDALQCCHQLTEKGLVLFIMNFAAIVQVDGADDDAPRNDTGPMGKL